ncbi:MAG: ion transporter [Ruminococcus sp.]|nr:ion transporter [Ruminococcus sp.]
MELTDERKSKYRKIKKRIFDIIQIGNRYDVPSRAFDMFIVATIMVNILTLFLDSFDEMADHHSFFRVCEGVTVLIFAVEYVLRIWTSEFLYPKKGKVSAVLRFLRSFDGVVDLLTILPFFFLDGFIVFRMLRVVRIFHLFRVNARYDSFHIITSVLIEKKNQILSSVFIIIVLMLASSLGIYNVEHEAQPEVFRNAFSGIWWSVSTLLTVGYGDIYPITVVGRLMAICIAFLGVGVVAVPTGIISAGFVEQYTKKQHSDIKLKDLSKIGEVLVERGSVFCGKTVSEVESELSTRVYMIIRGELSIIAYENTKLKIGDILFLRADNINKSDEQ